MAPGCGFSAGALSTRSSRASPYPIGPAYESDCEPELANPAWDHS